MVSLIRLTEVTGPAMQPTTTKQRLACLDGLRALAAYLVLLHHVSFAAGTTFNSKWGSFYSRMDVGVSVFFVLSGYLLFRPMVEKIITNQPLGSARRFWRRRFWRIFPSYWVALIVMLMIGAVSVGGLGGFLLAIPLVQIYHPDHAIAGLTQAWSLATEVSFYVVLPGFGWVFAKYFSGLSKNRAAMKMLCALGLVYVSSFVFRVLMHAWGPSFEDISIHWLPAMVEIFALGMILAVVSVWAEHDSTIAQLCTTIARHAFACIMVCVLLFWVVSTQLDLAVGLSASGFGREMIRQTLYGLIGFILVMPFALGPNIPTRSHKFFGWAPIAWVGLVSYGVYLWHELTFAGDWAEYWMPWTLFDHRFIERLIVATIATLLIAGFNHRYIEDPIAKRFS